jgi:adenosylcobinamide-phosphate synthase
VKSRRQAALCLALILDMVVGDPPNRFHPVAWMGSAIAAAQHRAPRHGRKRQLAYGALLSVAGALTVAGLGRLIERLLARLPAPWDWLVEGGLLKTAFSVRGLASAAGEVRDALENDDLVEAQRLVGWHLVSRETATLSASQVAAATVESVAENASDGVVAPLLYYALGGLPAALAYRFVNTADSLLGYRDPAHEWLGKVPARLDDLANLFPARITAALLVLAAALADEDARTAWRIWRRDSWVTASPNAGHPMSAMAGALGVELEKVGHYRLGTRQRPPAVEDIGRAVRVMHVATALTAGLLVGLPLIAHACGRRQGRASR